MTNLITRADIARLAGVPLSTVEYYASQGLIRETARFGTTCVYDPGVVQTVKDVKSMAEAKVRLKAAPEALGSGGRV